MGTPEPVGKINLKVVHDEQALVITRAQFNAAPKFQGRGIVTTIYHNEFASGWILFSELERQQCPLPIEAFYLEGELSDDELSWLSTLNLDLRVRKLTADVAGFAIKIAAIMESSFREVLWIDTDNAPIQEPSFLFDDSEYVKKGSLFWRDVSGADRARFWHAESTIWPVFNVPHNDSEEFDSGQMLIDKERCWTELNLTVHFNSPFYQRLIQGDKDTFRLAWWQIYLRRGGKILHHNTLTGDVPYGFMPYGPFHVGRPNPWNKWGGGCVMVQRDRQGQPLFNHRTIFKWTIDSEGHEDTPQDAIYVKHLERLKEIIAAR